ncbi:MAG: nucleotidyltransferase domain-containing protein [Candidatus Omnitrophota bacterium]|jgi:predicted nucleotidyltransferase|nr:MAG: nucleotidyltransferase domain-containing protein [Candidatus Omnitrophota bacterium]
MIDLEKKYLHEVKRILREYVPDCRVRVFGSRVDGTARQYSDLDLCVEGTAPIDPQILEELKYAFAESDLPIIVDVSDWHSVSDSFRKIILRTHELL